MTELHVKHHHRHLAVHFVDPQRFSDALNGFVTPVGASLPASFAHRVASGVSTSSGSGSTRPPLPRSQRHSTARRVSRKSGALQPAFQYHSSVETPPQPLASDTTLISESHASITAEQCAGPKLSTWDAAALLKDDGKLADHLAQVGNPQAVSLARLQLTSEVASTSFEMLLSQIAPAPALRNRQQSTGESGSSNLRIVFAEQETVTAPTLLAQPLQQASAVISHVSPPVMVPAKVAQISRTASPPAPPQADASQRMEKLIRIASPTLGTAEYVMKPISFQLPMPTVEAADDVA